MFIQFSYETQLIVKMFQSNDEKCQIHCDNTLQHYCTTCKKSACEDCDNFMKCFKEKHEVKPMRIAIETTNKKANEVIEISKKIKHKLDEQFNSLFDDRADFKTHIELCQKTIKHQKRTIIKKIEEKSKKLIICLENLSKQYDEAMESHVKELESRQNEVQKIKNLVSNAMNKPQEIENLECYQKNMNDVSMKFIKDFSKNLIYKGNLIPTFNPFTPLDDVIDEGGIGEITCIDNRYIIDKHHQMITVTKRQPLRIQLLKLTETDSYEVAAAVRNAFGKESVAEIEDLGNGKYSIKTTCDEEGDWQMRITAGVAQVRGSPVTIKVEPLGLVHTTDNITNYKRQYEKANTVSDVVVAEDGHLLASSYSNRLLKFDQSGTFIGRMQILADVHTGRMHKMANGHVLISDEKGKCVTMFDSKLRLIQSFGQGIIRYPLGLAVNEKEKILYVADINCNCVIKFNVDDGKLLGKIGSEGSADGQFINPFDITVTQEGHVVVADCGNNRIQMFDKNDKFLKILIPSGEDEGQVQCPQGLATDDEGNIIVSSENKLQLFKQNGDFVSRIDNANDELEIPQGITVVSNYPRRVAVANCWKYNIKTFNY